MGLQPKSLVGLLPRLFVVSSGNDKFLVLRIPALTVKGKEKNHGDPWLYRARGVGKTPRLSFGNRVGVHLWIWSPHGEDVPVPNLLAQIIQPCLIPALVLLPGMARTFLNHRSDQTLSSQHPPAAVHCLQHKSDSRAQCGGACPRPGDLTIFPFPPGEAPTQTSAQPCRATPAGLSLATRPPRAGSSWLRPASSYLILLWLPLPVAGLPSFCWSPSRSRSFSSCSRWSSSWWGRLRSEGPGEAAGCTSPFRLMSLAERCRGRGEARALGPASRRRFA